MAKISSMALGSCLFVDSGRSEDLLLINESVGESEQNDLPVRKSFTYIVKLSIIVSCHYVDSTRRKDSPLTDQSVSHSEQKNLPVRTLVHFIRVLPLSMLIDKIKTTVAEVVSVGLYQSNLFFCKLFKELFGQGWTAMFHSAATR